MHTSALICSAPEASPSDLGIGSLHEDPFHPHRCPEVVTHCLQPSSDMAETKEEEENLSDESQQQPCAWGEEDVEEDVLEGTRGASEGPDPWLSDTDGAEQEVTVITSVGPRKNQAPGIAH